MLEAIFTGDLTVGDKLPSEKELQEIFGVGRVTVREAIQSLRQFGVIEVRQGSRGGSYVREMDLNTVLAQTENALKMTNLTIQQVTEARVVIEESTLRRLLPSKIKAVDLKKLENVIASGDERFKDVNAKKGVLDYIDFHSVLAEMTGNPIIILMNKLIHRLLLQFFENVESSIPMTESNLKDHKTIARLVREGKFEAAGRVSAKHIDKVGKQMEEKAKQQSLLGSRRKN